MSQRSEYKLVRIMSGRKWLESLSNTYLAAALSKGPCSMCVYGERNRLGDGFHCTVDHYDFEDLCQEGISFWLQR